MQSGLARVSFLKKARSVSFDAKPAHDVVRDAQGLGLFENRIGLVAGAEVEHAALAHCPHAAAAAVLAFFLALLEDDGIGRGYVEGIVIHLGLRDVPFLRQARGDGALRQHGRDVRWRAGSCDQKFVRAGAPVWGAISIQSISMGCSCFGR